LKARISLFRANYALRFLDFKKICLKPKRNNIIFQPVPCWFLLSSLSA